MFVEQLKPGLRVEGVIPGEVITVIAAQWHGEHALQLTYNQTSGALGQQVVIEKDEGALGIPAGGELLNGGAIGGL